MADINIRLVASANLEGFNQAVKGMKEVEQQISKSYTGVQNNIPKMKKAFSEILNSEKGGMEAAGKFFQNWANAMIYNFTGGDAAKLKTQLEKAIGEVVNVAGTGLKDFVDMDALNENYRSVVNIYNEMADSATSSSARAQRAFEAELDVLRKLGDREGELSLETKHFREEMEKLARAGQSNTAEFNKLADQYKEAKAELDKLNSSHKLFNGNFGQYLTSTATAMVMHKAVSAVMRTVTQTFKESSKAAAEAEQIYNKLNTVFEGFTDTAKQMASELSSSIGVAKSTASSALTTIGDLLQAQGEGVSDSLEKASDWVKRFQDIINFKDINMSLDEFSSNMMAGFLGNTRNLRSVGVVIKDSAVQAELARRNMDKLTGSELELAKMNIRAEMTFKQLDNAMGATEREWDSMLAVNRRYEEAQKEFKENLGDTINNFLKPMKSWWTEILEEMNRAIKAQKEYNEGQRVSNTVSYDNKETREQAIEGARSQFNLTNNLIREVSGYDSNLKNLSSDDTEKFSYYLDELAKKLTFFGFSIDDTRKAFGDKLSPAVLEYIKVVNDRILAEEQEVKNIEARTSRLSSATEAFDKFQESLLGITGVNFVAPDVSDLTGRTSSDTAMNWALGQMNSITQFNIEKAIQSIAEADLSTWGDVISGELEGLDISALFEKKMESVAQLFTATWNEYLKDGVIDDDERATLEKIKSLYGDIADEQTAYNNGLEYEKNVKDAVASMNSNAKGYQTQFEQLGMSSPEKAVDDLKRTFNETLATLGLVGDEFDKLVADYEEGSEKMSEDERKRIEDMIAKRNELNGAYSKELVWLEKLQKAQAENERKEKAKTAILEAQNGLLDIQKQISQLYMTDEEKALDDIKRAYQDQIKTLDLTESEQAQLALQYKTQYEALQKLQEMQKAYNEALEREEKRKQSLAEYQEQRTDYRTQLSQLGMTDRQITESNLMSAGRNAMRSGDIELARQIYLTLFAFEKLQNALEKIELDKKIEDINTSFSANAYAAEIATLRMNENEKALYDLDSEYERQLEEMKKLGGDTTTLTNNYQDQRKALVQLQSLQKNYNDELDRQAKLDSYGNKATDYRTQLENLGKSNNEIVRQGYVDAMNEAEQAGDWELYRSILDTIVAFDLLNEAIKKNEDAQKEAAKTFQDKITEGMFGKYADTTWAKGIGGSIANSTGGQIIQAGIEGAAAGGPWGAILGVLMAILSKTETFQKVLEMVEPVIEIFDSLLAPLAPAIQVITNLLNSMLMMFLKPLFPVIKDVSIVIVTIGKVIQTINAVIHNIYTAVHNVLEHILHPITGGDQWEYESITDIWADYFKTVQEIRDLTFDIKENTDKTDTSQITAMYNAGAITASEYQALMANAYGRHWDNMKSYGGLAWQNGSGGTTVIYSGGISVTIEGTNIKDGKEAAQAFAREIQRLGYTGEF